MIKNKKWVDYKIPELFFFQEGPGVRKWQFRDNGIKLLNVGNINNGKINLSTTSKYLEEEEAMGKYSHFLIDPGDLLIACSGIVVSNFHNKIAFANEDHLPLCLNTSTMRFKVLDPQKADIQFFKFYLQSQLFSGQLQRLITGSAQLNFGPSHIKKITIPLPPLPEQRRIAAILDAADALRRHDKALIEQYDALIQSVFHEMFGDLDGELSSISSISTINPPKKKISNLSKSLEVSFISMSKVSETGEIILNENKSIGEVWSGFTFFEENDVLFAKITPCMENGKGGIARGLENGIGFGSTEFHILRPNDLSTPDYLYYLTKLEKFRKQAEQNMTGSAGQKRVPKSFFDKYMVVVPSIPLQQQFANRVSAIKAQKAHAQESLAQSEALFGSLMQKAFKGEL